jgi:two-component system NtrC family sensor kinase
MVKPIIKRKDIQLRINLQENLPDTVADAKQIQQVFINLLTNASDAIDGSGEIRINIYTEIGEKTNEGSYVVASIGDTGSGIQPEDLQKIFNPFFTRKTEGTGLGLPITQRILHQHNGVIDVESNANEGTCF